LQTHRFAGSASAAVLKRSTAVSDVALPAKADTTAKWWVQVRGKPFGPYALDQMARFMAEGRVRPTTLVADKPEGEWIEARRVIALRGLRAPTVGRKEEQTEAANVFVHAEIVSGSWNAFMAALEGMGAVCDLAPGLWLVRTRFSAGVIRNTLSQTLERGDRFVVIDATRDRFAWFNLGPEIDVRIGKVWNGPLRDEKAR
jgi:hypothetical protein